MAGFTPQELEEMAQADAEIEAAFEVWMPPQTSAATMDLVWVSRLAREQRTTYGKFVAAHSREEIEALVEQRKGEPT